MNFKEKLSDFKQHLSLDNNISKVQETKKGKIIPSAEIEVQLNIYISKSLRADLKIIAAQKGTELKKMITNLLLGFVEENQNR